jgi:hypothetical protein
MGNPAGVRRDFQGLEQRRLRAARLLKKGVHQSEVARQVGAHRQSVSRWAQQLEAAGVSGLRKAGGAGRKPRLSEADREKIEHGLKRGPEALGYETGLKRTEPTPAPLPDLGASGTNPGAAIPLQLEDAVGNRGGDVVELLLSAVSRSHSQPADHRVSLPPDAPHSRQTADRLGWSTWTSQSRRVGLRARAEGALVAGVSSRLCARTEPGGISMVTLETARVTQLLSHDLWPIEPSCPTSVASQSADLVIAFWQQAELFPPYLYYATFNSSTHATKLIVR